MENASNGRPDYDRLIPLMLVAHFMRSRVRRVITFAVPWVAENAVRHGIHRGV
jgi:hypothetical protein